jgi:hypothetical protein
MQNGTPIRSAQRGRAAVDNVTWKTESDRLQLTKLKQAQKQLQNNVDNIKAQLTHRIGFVER